MSTHQKKPNHPAKGKTTPKPTPAPRKAAKASRSPTKRRTATSAPKAPDAPATSTGELSGDASRFADDVERAARSAENDERDDRARRDREEDEDAKRVAIEDGEPDGRAHGLDTMPCDGCGVPTTRRPTTIPTDDRTTILCRDCASEARAAIARGFGVREADHEPEA